VSARSTVPCTEPPTGSAEMRALPTRIFVSRPAYLSVVPIDLALQLRESVTHCAGLSAPIAAWWPRMFCEVSMEGWLDI
jgi:hypothetical protein